MPGYRTIALRTNDLVSGEELEFDDVSPTHIAEVLLRFDGRSIDNILITIDTGDNEVQVGLSDGRNGWCSIFFLGAAGTWYLCATEPPAQTARRYVLTVVAETETDQWTHWVAPTTSATRSLWYFLLTGDRDPGLIWEHLDPTTFSPTGLADPWPENPPRLAAPSTTHTP